MNNQSIGICKHYSGNNSEFEIDSKSYNPFLIYLNSLIKHSLSYFSGIGFSELYKILTATLVMGVNTFVKQKGCHVLHISFSKWN